MGSKCDVQLCRDGEEIRSGCNDGYGRDGKEIGGPGCVVQQRSWSAGCLRSG